MAIFIILFIYLPSIICHSINNFISHDFGPIITLKNDKANIITFNFYSTKNEKFKITFWGKLYQEVFLIENNNKKWHRFNLKINNLKEIYYKVETYNSQFNNLYEKLNLPNNHIYQILIVGDTKDSFDIFSNMIDKVLKNNSPSILVHLGDFIDNPIDKKEWHNFYNSGKNILSKTIIIPVIGNHDYYSQLWQNIFDVPDNFHSFYDYEILNLHYIILNSDMYFGEDSIQYNWLKKQLQKKELPKIIFLHHPFYTSVLSHKDDYKINALQKILLPLLTNSNVKLVISGHDHLYERYSINGICFITSGGCAKIFDSEIAENIFREKLITNINHYIILNVKKDIIQINTFSLDNSLLDTYIIYLNK